MYVCVYLRKLITVVRVDRSLWEGVRDREGILLIFIRGGSRCMRRSLGDSKYAQVDDIFRVLNGSNALITDNFTKKFYNISRSSRQNPSKYSSEYSSNNPFKNFRKHHFWNYSKNHSRSNLKNIFKSSCKGPSQNVSKSFFEIFFNKFYESF